MEYLLGGIAGARHIIVSGDAAFRSAVCSSLILAMVSTSPATGLGVPLGLALAHCRFRGRDAVFTLVNTLVSLPTVLIGLVVYSVLSRQAGVGRCGPLD